MADKKKMSVADMLAAARKTDVGDAAPADAAPPATSPAATGSAETPAEETSTPAPAAPLKPATGAGGGRPSVAEMMALARAGGGATPAAKKPAEKPAPKAAPAPKPAAVKAAPSVAAPTPDRDTGSVLGGGIKKDKAGPMSKAAAAALPAAASPKPPAQPKIIVPPMPLKPDYAKPKAPTVKVVVDDPDRRVATFGFMALGFWLVGLISTLWTLATVKFMFPNVLREPPSKFKVGFPDAFPGGQVQEKFKAQFGIWVVSTEYNGTPQIFALKSVCTHLGCTPNWLEAEQKFKCPCHGSGFYKDGINFEGPAPRPLERYAIRLSDDGQIEVDKGRIFQEEMGQWADPSCYIPV